MLIFSLQKYARWIIPRHHHPKIWTRPNTNMYGDYWRAPFVVADHNLQLPSFAADNQHVRPPVQRINDTHRIGSKKKDWISLDTQFWIL